MQRINQVVLSGGITRDPEFKTVGTGTELLTGSIAQTKMKKEGNEWIAGNTSYFNFVMWNPTKGAKTLKKGDQVIVTGEVEPHCYESADAGKKCNTQIIIRTITKIAKAIKQPEYTQVENDIIIEPKDDGDVPF